MKSIIILYYLLLIILCPLAAQKSQLHLNLTVGVRTVDDKEMYGIGIAVNRKMYPALTIGFDISHDNYPFSLSIQQDFESRFFPFNNSIDSLLPSLPSILISSRRFDHIIIYRKFNQNLKIGIGHYWDQLDNIVVHLVPNITTKYRGLEMCIIYEALGIDIELRHRINYAPIFSVLSFSQTSFSFLHRIGKESQNEGRKTNERKLAARTVIGGRFFVPKGIKTLQGEKLNKVVFAPIVGIEFYLPKQKFSFNMEKDWWLDLNAGSFTRNIKGFISNTSLGFKYHQSLENGNHLRYGLSATWIDDFQNLRDNRGYSPNGQLRYNDFGIGANLSYEFVPNWDLEAKHTFTLVDDDSPFTLRRFSIGLIHRFEPYRP